MKKKFSIFLLIFFVSVNINAEISGVNIDDLTQLYKEQITKILVGNKLFGHYDGDYYRGPVEEIHYQNGDYEIIHSGIFRWKYALCNRSNLKNKFTFISDDSFAIGDWNISPRVESAYISGSALGKYLNETRL